MKTTVKQLCLGGLCIGLAFALSFIKFLELPQGGSLTPASMLPLMIFSYIYGFKKGAVACLAYGLLQLLQDNYVVHWVQLFVDYIFAFVALALAGVFKHTKFKKINTIFLGICLGVVGRYVMHVISGAVFFGEYAPVGQNVWAYSSIYNSYVLIEGLLCIVVMLLPQLLSFITAKRIEVRGE